MLLRGRCRGRGRSVRSRREHVFGKLRSPAAHCARRLRPRLRRKGLDRARWRLNFVRLRLTARAALRRFRGSLVRELSCLSFSEAVDAREKGGEGLSAAGGGDEECVGTGVDTRPTFALHVGGSLEIFAEPARCGRAKAFHAVLGARRGKGRVYESVLSLSKKTRYSIHVPRERAL